MADYSLVDDVGQLLFGVIGVWCVIPLVTVMVAAGVAAVMNILTGHMLDG